jgi:hypothetical protein
MIFIALSYMGREAGVEIGIGGKTPKVPITLLLTSHLVYLAPV